MKSVALLLALCFSGAASLRICSFNVQIFGEAKGSKKEVMTVLQKIVSRCDIMLLMEIRDSKDVAIHALMAKLNSHTKGKHEFNLLISERLGRSMSKEQYAFIYRKNSVTVIDFYQYKDQQAGDVDVFSREPFIVWFKSLNTEVNDFVIIPQHTVPEDAVREIDELYDVYLEVRQTWNTENIIFMGDFNAGCSYVPKKSWKNIRLRANPEFVWLIGDKMDTTVRSTTRCAYDRIVLHGATLISSIVPDSATTFDFTRAYRLTEEQALEVSDHYPVEFQLNEPNNSPRKTSRRRDGRR
ncbi:PREDICTED: deoxyribonuclease gamma isoform X1 [Nanorana parkeri]|uniref:deoxyribonuclease gamma isoform X1 n=1 Tax=Nanorana parkeri TaxID=125878 RepID=UPI0008542EA4|nr:PREDICTED: deoxyribonuclease gamma isoform X1 [Nanorana parkeri]